MVCKCIRHLPRQQDVFIDDSNDDGALRNAKKTYLIHAEMAIRLREVYNTLVPYFGSTTDLKSIPEWKKEGMKLNIFLLEKAANMCGLNGQKFSRWYSVSRWAKENNNPLSFEEFQSIIERYAQAGRNTEKIRSLIEETLKKNGKRLQFDLNDSNKYQIVYSEYQPKCTPTQKISYCPCVGTVVDPLVYKVMHRAEIILKNNKMIDNINTKTNKFWQI